VSRPTTAGFVDFETTMNKAFADIRNGAAAKDRLEQASQELERTLKKYQGQ
jgi:multiple sugar transport system substrate-binding protein